MAVFGGPDDVDRLIGGMFRLAGDHPHIGPALASAASVLRLELSEPSCCMTLELVPPIRVNFGACDTVPDITLRLAADRLHYFWRGEYDLREGIADGQVECLGRLSRVLKVLPHVKPLFPLYRAMVDANRPVVAAEVGSTSGL